MLFSQNLIDLEQELLKQAVVDGIEKLVVGSVVILNGKILLLKRSESDDFLPGYIEIPGGGVDKDESILAAVIREHQEETGIIPQSLESYIGCFDYVSNSGKKVRQFNFLLITDNEEVSCNPVEHSEFLWLDINDTDHLRTLNMSDEMRKLVENVPMKLRGFKN